MHGLAVQNALRQRDGVVCHYVATNDSIAAGGLEWTTEQETPIRLRSDEGVWFNVAELDAIWWRRANYDQLEHPGVHTDKHLRLATTEWKSALLGTLLDAFRGVWINHPEATARAEHKILQLRAAQAAGLKIPATYVGQDPCSLRVFFAQHSLEKLVIKKVRGTLDTPLLTVRITPDDLTDEASIRLCPAIYQVEVSGSLHLRLHVFGSEVIAVSVESNALDWRPNLNVPMRPYNLDRIHKEKLIALNKALGLEMSIMDAKIDANGDLVWLEANPQGAFLFVQAISDVNLIDAFCDFVLQKASQIGEKID
jgi:hypothetical protein